MSKVLVAALLLGIVLSSLTYAVSAYAVGIVTDYNSENVYATTSEKVGYFNFRIQNNAGDSDLVIEVEVASDRNIASVPYSSVTVKKGYSMDFYVKVELPNDTKVGDLYNVSYSVSAYPNAVGQIIMRQSIGKSFTIHVVDSVPGGDYMLSQIFTGPVERSLTPKEDPSPLPYIEVIAGIGVLAAIAVLAYKFNILDLVMG